HAATLRRAAFERGRRRKRRRHDAFTRSKALVRALARMAGKLRKAGASVYAHCDTLTPAFLTAARPDLPHQIRAFRLSCVQSPSIPLGPAIRAMCIQRMQESFMNTKLYVGNLPFETTESDLQALFGGGREVNTINIVRDRATGQARGFAFVEMSDTAGAER